MIAAVLILVLSSAMCCFYFRVTCQEILHRRFEREYFYAIASANLLGFQSLGFSPEGLAATFDYAELRQTLHCDYRRLTFLLKNATNIDLCYSTAERFLMVYFRWHFFSWAMRHLLKIEERRAILRLISVLQYFANVIGRRVELCRAPAA
jgi:hypothetical protein